MKEIVIDGVVYAPKSSDNVSPIKIVVLQRGWNVIGRWSQDGDMVTLANASVIRNWGTTRGLGELAENGKTSKTVLDPCNGVVTFHILTMVMSIDCKESAWGTL